MAAAEPLYPFSDLSNLDILNATKVRVSFVFRLKIQLPLDEYTERLKTMVVGSHEHQQFFGDMRFSLTPPQVEGIETISLLPEIRKFVIKPADEPGFIYMAMSLYLTSYTDSIEKLCQIDHTTVKATVYHNHYGDLPTEVDLSQKFHEK